MIELTEYIHSQREMRQVDFSLSGWLEAMIGNYYVKGEGDGGRYFRWLTIYYAVDMDALYEGCEIVKANIVAYVSSDYRWSFVLDRHIQKFKKDTAGYGMCYIPVSDFSQELLQCSRISLLPREFSGIVWIDDDFMDDGNIPFDFDGFSLIDDGIPYLNPKHFSVEQLAAAMEK